jgi:hypothetical protein
VPGKNLRSLRGRSMGLFLIFAIFYIEPHLLPTLRIIFMHGYEPQ